MHANTQCETRSPGVLLMAPMLVDSARRHGRLTGRASAVDPDVAVTTGSSRVGGRALERCARALNSSGQIVCRRPASSTSTPLLRWTGVLDRRSLLVVATGSLS